MELAFVDWLTREFGKNSSPALRLGIGDDAAVLALGADVDCVVTTDMLMEGVHFDLGSQALERVGRKALAVNLSDLAAMAAEPVAAFVSLALRADNGRVVGQGLIRGMAALAEQYHVAIAGGDTNCWSGPVVINVALVGRCERGRTLTRSGARPGDVIVVTGEFGGSILGKHLDFEPRVDVARRLRAGFELHAGCDVSDGLALDLDRVARASGCGAVLLADRIPVSAAARRQAEVSGRTPLEHALGDGEDFELLLAAPPAESRRMREASPAEVALREVGFFTEQPGLWLADAQGRREPLPPLGYRHGDTETLER